MARYFLSLLFATNSPSEDLSERLNLSSGGSMGTVSRCEAPTGEGEANHEASCVSCFRGDAADAAKMLEPSVSGYSLAPRAVCWCALAKNARSRQGQHPGRCKEFAFLERSALQGVRESLPLLDRDGGGKVWEVDFDALVRLALGADRCPGGACWHRFKDACRSYDGMLVLERMSAALSAALPEDALESDAHVGSVIRGDLGPFDDLLQYVATFSSFDMDGNGVICAKDLRQSLSFLAVDVPSLKACKDIIQKVDRNLDGVVELDEFGLLASYLQESLLMPE